jgi:hypothetical protein
MPENPYAAPKSHVEDPRPALADGDFLPEGRSVAAGNGWQWIVDAWAFTGQQRWTFIGVFILYLLVLMAFGLVPFVGAIASALLTPVVNGGLQLGFDAVRRGGPLEVGLLFAGFKRNTGRLIAIGAISFGIWVLVVLILLAVLLVTFGPVLFGGGEPSIEDLRALILPALLAVLIAIAVSLPLYMALWFTVPLIVLGDLEVGAAIKASFFACLKNLLPFLVWSVMVLLLAIAVFIPPALLWQPLGPAVAITMGVLLWVGWILLAGPVLTVSIYLGYRDIFYES